MRTFGIAALVALGMLGGSTPAAAQVAVRGFAGGGSSSEGSRTYPSFGGGVLVNVGQPWVSVGGQGDAFVSLPYVAGRGAVFVQGNLLTKGAIRPFVLAGEGFGTYDGTLLGGGVEIRPAGSRLGFRGSVENYRKTYTHFTGSEPTNQVTVRLSVLFY